MKLFATLQLQEDPEKVLYLFPASNNVDCVPKKLAYVSK